MASLFRRQAVVRQSQRLYGDVRLDTSVSTWIMTGLIALVVAAAAAALVLGSYARKETVTGWLVPDKGLAEVVAPEPSTVTTVHVALGDTVAAGQPLVSLSSDAAMAAGGSETERLLRELDAERAEIVTQIGLTGQQATKERASSRERRDGLGAERRHVQAQLESQSARVALNADTVERVTELLAEDAASPLEVNRAREALLSSQQAASSLRQRLAVIDRDVRALSAAIDRSSLEEETALSQLRGRLALMDQRRTEYERRSGSVLRAPMDGRVSTLNVRPGEAVMPGVTLVGLLPSGGRLEAELFIPTRAAGFVSIGQEARLQLDAFPHQRFGVVSGEVTGLAQTVTSPQDLPVPVPLPGPVYRSTVALNAQDVDAYGQTFALQAGMTVQADIVQEERSLWRLLLDPLLSRS